VRIHRHGFSPRSGFHAFAPIILLFFSFASRVRRWLSLCCVVRGVMTSAATAQPSATCGGSPFAVWSVGQPQAAPRTTQQTCLRSAAGAEESRGSDLKSYVYYCKPL